VKGDPTRGQDGVEEDWGKKGGECDEVSFPPICMLLGEKVDRAISYIGLHGRGDRR
jgi:hypothetical protein